MTQHGPQHSSVELGAIVSTDALTLNFEGLGDPHGDVADYEECDKLTTRLAQAQRARVAASPQPVDDERCLQQHLKNLSVLEEIS